MKLSKKGLYNAAINSTAELNQTILVGIHDFNFAHRTNRIIEMEDGKISR